MTRPLRTVCLSTAAVFALTLALPANAANLVLNGTFEDGLRNWKQFGNRNYSGLIAGAGAHSGTWGATFAPNGSTGGIFQTIDTIVGQAYTIDYFLRFTGGTPSFESVSFGGVVLNTMTNPRSFAYSRFTFTQVATTAKTDLIFTFRSDKRFSSFDLDDVTVNKAIIAVPETATWAMLLSGFGVIGGAMRRSRKVLRLIAA